MVCLGFEPGAAGWWAQMKPRSYGGHMLNTPVFVLNFIIHCVTASKSSLSLTALKPTFRSSGILVLTEVLLGRKFTAFVTYK